MTTPTGRGCFIATCGTCCRQARVNPAEVLTHPRTIFACAWPNSRSTCAVGTAATAPDHVARLPTQACVAGMM